MNTNRTTLEQDLQETSTRMIMHTIKWLNDTFVPMGMTPLEDLPKGDVGEPTSCVIAKALTQNFKERVQGLSVVPTYIEFKDSEGFYVCQDTDQDVHDFIEAFDHHEFPDLLSDYSKEQYESYEHMVDDDGKCECEECGGDVDAQEITEVACINCGATMGACLVKEYKHTLCDTCIRDGYELTTCIEELREV